LTLAEILHARGYQTAGFVANAYVSHFTGLDQGFEQYDYLGQGSLTHPFFINLIKPAQEDLGGRLVTERLIEWMEKARQNPRPFFIFANYLEVHEPYGTVPAEFRSRFVEKELPTDIGKTWIRETPRFLCTSCEEGATFEGLSCKDQRWRVDADHLRDIVTLYDAGVSYVDHLIGEVREKLEKLGVLDQTLIIVTSDHGEMLGESGRIGHGVFLHNAVLRVPLVMRYPRLLPAGTRLSAAVSLLDILPTVAEVAGIKLKPRPGSVSLIPAAALAERPFLVRAQESPFRASTIQSFERLLECDMRLARDRRLSMQKEQSKYVWSSSGKQELFDLETDPKEERDLAEALPDSARALRKELLDWAQSVRPKQGRPARNVELDARTKRELESLGYLQ
jgi:arylsulfatase A-like enzyme